MSFTPNSMVIGSFPRNINGSRPQAVSDAAHRVPPSILTYSYNSKLVYVTPGDTYEVRFCLSLLNCALLLTLLSLASHRFCPRCISRSQRRRSQPDMLRGSRGAQQSVRTKDGADRPNGVGYRGGHPCAIRDRGSTRRLPPSSPAFFLQAHGRSTTPICLRSGLVHGQGGAHQRSIVRSYPKSPITSVLFYHTRCRTIRSKVVSSSRLPS